MPPIIVEAAETWPVVIAGLISGLGAAVIVAVVTLKAARKQRENDVRLAQQQRDADADMRDLQYLRETLAPIAEHAIGWEAFTSLHFLLDQAENREFDEWKEAIQQPLDQVGKTAERLRRDRRVLVVLLGPEAEVSMWLGELAGDGDALIHLARQRVEAKQTTPEIRLALDGLWMKYGFDQSRFLEHANKVVRLGSD